MCNKSWVRSLFLVTRLAFIVIVFSEDMQSKALEPSLDRQTWISETRSIRSFTSGNPQDVQRQAFSPSIAWGDRHSMSIQRQKEHDTWRQALHDGTDRKTNTIQKQELNVTAYRQAGSLETGRPCCQVLHDSLETGGPCFLKTGTPRQSTDSQTMLSEDRHSTTVQRQADHAV